MLLARFGSVEIQPLRYAAAAVSFRHNVGGRNLEQRLLINRQHSFRQH
jgi:seryl-tRNA synthetase